MKNVKLRIILTMVLSLLITFMMTTTAVYAANDWGKNAGQWVMDQAWWLALAVIAVVCIKFAVKKMWAQFFGFLVLGGLVVFFVKYPDKLLLVGQTLYNIVTGS